MALLHFIIELLSGPVNLHSVSGCHLLRRQINIDSLLSAFSSSTIRRNGRQIPTLDQAAGQLVNFLKRRGKKGSPSFFFFFFWRVVDQAQKHFHYSRLYLQFIKQPSVHSAHTKSRKSSMPPPHFHPADGKMTSLWKWVKNII